MPAYCAVLGCNSQGGRTIGAKFYRFPILDKKSLAISQTRQRAWLAALRRKDFFPSQYRNARVCNLHFISGRSAALTDVDNPDWVPALRMGYTRVSPKAIKEEKCREDTHLNPDDVIPMKVEACPGEKDTQTEISSKSVGTQTKFETTSCSTQTNDR